MKKIKFQIPNYLIDTEEYEAGTQVVKKLQSLGFTTYFAGGPIRDCLLGIKPTDWDIATSASTDIILSSFEKTVPTGIKFGSITVIKDKTQFEVSTFRKDGPYTNGRAPEYTTFSDAEEDAKRRDLTINGLFYDPTTLEIIDFVNGIEDIKTKTIRCIGNATDRFEEDKLRIIRAARICAKINGNITENTLNEMKKLSFKILQSVSKERILSELISMSKLETPSIGFEILIKTSVIENIFPFKTNVDYKQRIERLDLNKSRPAWSYLLAIISGPNFQTNDKQINSLINALPWSNNDKKIILFTTQLAFTLLHKKHLNKFENCKLQASPYFHLAIKIISCITGDFSIIKQQEEFYIEQKFFIDNIKNSNRIIKSTDLIDLGIKPGIQMGIILSYAEEVSIEKNLKSKSELLKEIKHHFFYLFN